jgi:N-acetylglucosamine repressor
LKSIASKGDIIAERGLTFILTVLNYLVKETKYLKGDIMRSIGNKPDSIKRVNKSLILRVVNNEELISRAELSRKVELTIPTVMKIVDELLEEGLLREVGVGESSGGRPPKLLELNSKGKHVVAVKILPDELQVGVSNLKNIFLLKKTKNIHPKAGYQKILAELKKTIRQVIKESGIGWERILGIGIGVPGVVNYLTGEVRSAPNLKGWRNIRLGSDIKEEFNVPVFVENEARVSTLAEKWHGVGREIENFVCVDVAVGIGSGLVIKGDLYRGFESLAGEIGHSTVMENGHLCNCGKRGCLETVASNTAILKSIKADPGDIIMQLCEGDKNLITMDLVVRAAKMGDRKSRKCIEKAAKYLGKVIGGLVNVVNPEIIIINGKITAAGEAFFAPLQDQVKKYSFRGNNQSINITSSRLGANGGLIGAASLVLRRVFRA